MTSAIASARDVLKDVLIGRRGLVKTIHIWLAVAAATAATMQPPRINEDVPTAGLALFGAIGLWSLFSIWLNDLVDANQDAAAGKRRWICALPPVVGWRIVLLLPVLGFVALAVRAAPIRVLVAYVAAVLASAGYSLPPARLKDRGLLGVLGYGVPTTIAFALMPWLWLAPYNQEMLGTLVCTAVLLDKSTILLFHQIVDFNADCDTGADTYAVRLGLERARRRLQHLATASGLYLAGIAVTLFLLFIRLAVHERGAPTHIRMLASVVYRNMDCVYLLPLALLLLWPALVVYSRQKRAVPEDSGNRLRTELPLVYLIGSACAFRAMPVIVLTLVTLAKPAFALPAALALGALLIETAHATRYRYE